MADQAPPKPSEAISVHLPPGSHRSDTLTTPSTPTLTSLSSKASKQRCRFSKEDDLVVVREFTAAKAHVAPNGETRERFEIVAAKVSAGKLVKHAVTWASVQQRYKRLQERYDKKEVIESKISGLGGDVGQLEEVLGMMKETHDDLARCKGEKKRKKLELDERKERLGALIRQRATRRKEAKEIEMELETSMKSAR